MSQLPLPFFLFTDPNGEEGGLSEFDALILTVGSNHGFSCTCPICYDWWVSVGPEPDLKPDGTLSFGPFTEAEIAKRVGPEKMAMWRMSITQDDDVGLPF